MNQNTIDSYDKLNEATADAAESASELGYKIKKLTHGRKYRNPMAHLTPKKKKRKK